MSVKKWLSASALGRRTTTRLAVCAVAVGAAVFGLPSPSWAEASYFDWCSRGNVSCQTGAEVSGPSSGTDYCVQERASYTTVCINYDGDVVFVYDGSSDGNSAIGMVSTGSVGDVTGRWCRNSHGAGTWARCNFDWVEDTHKWVYGGVRIDNDEARYSLLWEVIGG